MVTLETLNAAETDLHTVCDAYDKLWGEYYRRRSSSKELAQQIVMQAKAVLAADNRYDKMLREYTVEHTEY